MVTELKAGQWVYGVSKLFIGRNRANTRDEAIELLQIMANETGSKVGYIGQVVRESLEEPKSSLILREWRNQASKSGLTNLDWLYKYDPDEWDRLDQMLADAVTAWMVGNGISWDYLVVPYFEEIQFELAT